MLLNKLVVMLDRSKWLTLNFPTLLSNLYYKYYTLDLSHLSERLHNKGFRVALG
jgi:hypothetical protein